MKFDTVKRILKNPYIMIGILNRKGLLKWISDESYLKWRFEKSLGYPLNLSNPTTFNEKLQWLKLYDRKPKYTNLVNKYKVREYIKEKIGEDYLIPLYGVWSNFDEINFHELPKSFVLKTTHDSGSVVICKDRSNFDKEKARKILSKSLKNNYYYSGREWPYKNTERMIIAEKYMEDIETGELRDYKFFTFNGAVKFMFIASDRGKNTSFDFYDREFNHIPVSQHYPNSNKQILKPNNFEKMIELAEKLGSEFPHVRVDFYEANNKIYFGELTFTHFSGFYKFKPLKYDHIFGEYLDIEAVKG